ncbi:MAG: hypothetical protein JKY63_04065, partial [Rhodobiaceae bacterium]|nr:hypothetical protein [Rhodobiaceae bacterium]
ARVALNKELEASVELVGLLSSKKALLKEEGIALDSWKQDFEQRATPWLHDHMFEQLQALECDELIALDIRELVQPNFKG